MNLFTYRGKDKQKNYFEGWYIRLLDINNNNKSYAIIFGITFYEKDPHAFIQIINNQTKQANYLRFNIKDFSYDDKSITIKGNILSPSKLILKTDELTIDVTNEEFELVKRKGVIRSIMGFFKYLPLGSAYEIIYLSAITRGKVIDNKNKYDFNGISYMEKNWGDTFPKKWLWIQANHFEKNDAQFVLVYTTFLRFPIFLCLLKVNGVEYRFATYNGAHLKCLKISSKEILLKAIKDDYKLYIKLNYNEDHPIKGPIKNGQMIKTLNESINSSLFLSLYDKATAIFRDNADNVGCENLFK